MEHEEVTLSYYEAKLRKFLNEYHPDKANDNKFIEERSREAEELNENLVRDGLGIYSAHEIAMSVLMDGLEFSLYHFIHDLICEDFPNVPAKKRRDYTLSLLPRCEEVLANFGTTNPYTHPDRLIIELEIIGMIAFYLEEHDL